MYEHFVRNFYKKELKGYRVSSEIIDWDDESEAVGSYLPIMKTDISIENEQVKRIIDMEYSNTTLSKGDLMQKRSKVRIFTRFTLT